MHRLFRGTPIEVEHDFGTEEDGQDVADTLGYEMGKEAEREKWLPLWDAVKELDECSVFEQSSRNDEPHSVLIAKANMRQVMITLRSTGEK